MNASDVRRIALSCANPATESLAACRISPSISAMAMLQQFAIAGGNLAHPGEVVVSLSTQWLLLERRDRKRSIF
jgi:hypothetical protein